MRQRRGRGEEGQEAEREIRSGCPGRPDCGEDTDLALERQPQTAKIEQQDAGRGERADGHRADERERREGEHAAQREDRARHRREVRRGPDSFDAPKDAGSGARWTGLAGLDGTAELFVMKATLAEDLGHGLEITLSSGTARLPISR